MIRLESKENSFTVSFNGLEVLSHSKDHPILSCANGDGRISMYRGNFQIKDSVSGHDELADFRIESRSDSKLCISFSGKSHEAVLTCDEVDGRLRIRLSGMDGANRFFLNLPSSSEEHIYGCGEQYSHLDLKGRSFPLFVREQGVGRNKKKLITKLADKLEGAGGDYYTTYYPQTTFVSSRKYFLHAYAWDYSCFDFSDPDFIHLEFWSIPESLIISVKSSMLETVQDITALLGRQSELPDWVYDGIVLGVQGGTEKAGFYLDQARKAGMKVAGLWAQDWEGKRVTSFGKRLCWNWVWDSQMYPGLDKWIPQLESEGVRFLGYINPYLLEGKSLYEEALSKGYLVMNHDGGPCLVDFGEFNGGIVDLTYEKAFDWYKLVIRRNMIDFGLSGWMADFGEYLPTDCVLHSGIDPVQAHDMWPGLWARVNREAVDESSKAGELMFFMRSGNAMSLGNASMVWAGDQNVDWSEDDGIKSVVTAALSLAMSGYGLHSSDIGGYTTLFSLKRSKELLLRWNEMAAFTVFMRTHEGNRPDKNWQFYSDEDTMEKIACMVDVHVALKPYIKHAVKQNAEQGIPVMRPLLLMFDENWCGSVKDEYVLGDDLLVCPVLGRGMSSRSVHLPKGEWVHLFTGESFGGGTFKVDAPIGMPPVFYRRESSFESLFKSLMRA